MIANNLCISGYTQGSYMHEGNGCLKSMLVWSFVWLKEIVSYLVRWKAVKEGGVVSLW